MARCFQQSREVYSQGDGARAKELSNEGKAHQQKMEELNKKASDWIYVGSLVRAPWNAHLLTRTMVENNRVRRSILEELAVCSIFFSRTADQEKSTCMDCTSKKLLRTPTPQ